VPERPRFFRRLAVRAVLAGLLISVLTATVAATAALEKVSTIAHELFPTTSHIAAPRSVVTPAYAGAAQTILLIGTDRRAKASDLYDRNNPPHSDTLLLVRLDPAQGQTSVLSIPRDLLVSITDLHGNTSYPNKINAAYTLGSEQDPKHDGGARLAAQTIEQVTGLKINNIVDVTFGGFTDVVDDLGGVYVNVDHRYYNPPNSGYSAINLQPGYQLLRYQNALDYVRYRHTDSDFVRVARQQDFIRSLKSQINVSRVLGQIDRISRAVGKAVQSTFTPSASDLLNLAQLVAFTQTKPYRQVYFQNTGQNYQLGGGSYVVATKQDVAKTVHDFLDSNQRVKLPSGSPSATSSSARKSTHHHTAPASSTATAPGLIATSSYDSGLAAQQSVNLPFRMLYPGMQLGTASQDQVRAYNLKDQAGKVHHAYVIVFASGIIGNYYDIQGTDWLTPPLIAHPNATKTINGRQYLFVNDGSHIHVVAWKQGKALYWVDNTLQETLSNHQIVAIAESVASLH
jgi:LCP family protein required for cell wall assembly